MPLSASFGNGQAQTEEAARIFPAETCGMDHRSGEDSRLSVTGDNDLRAVNIQDLWALAEMARAHAFALST